MRGNNEPLYVVDGVIISSAGEDVLPAGVGNSGQESQNGLNGINPRDIESIQVLKEHRPLLFMDLEVLMEWSL